MDNRDGDADKGVQFLVLRKVVMPSILSENFFMTNREESRLLLSEEGRDRIAKIHFQMIQEIESTKINLIRKLYISEYNIILVLI